MSHDFLGMIYATLSVFSTHSLGFSVFGRRHIIINDDSSFKQVCIEGK